MTQTSYEWNWPGSSTYNRYQWPYGRCQYWWDDFQKFGLSVTSAAALEPVDANDVKANSVISIDDDDLWIARRITAARQLCETFIKRCFVDTTFRLTLDRFPTVFYVPRPPLISVTSIKYLDNDGTQQTWATNQYTVDTYTEPGRIGLAWNVSLPTYRMIQNSIEVIYHAGYGTTAASVPQSVRDAIVLTVSQWYENRGDEGDKELGRLPSAAKSLLRANAWGYLP